MGGLTPLVGELLSLLHSIAGPEVCPGDWVWTITVAGVVLAVSPVFAASLVALVRRLTGNRYTADMVGLFAVLGLVGGAILPALGFVGAATAVQRAALGTGASGLSGQDVADLQDSYCFLPAQDGYLGGGGRSVSDAVTALPGPDWLLGGRAAVLLVALPLLAWLLVWALARLAVRRGPRWPSLLLWVPFLILLVVTFPLDEGVVSQLWVGYTAGLVPGLLLVLLIGRPRWSVIRRSAAVGQAPTQPPGGPADPPPTRQALPQPSPRQGAEGPPPTRQVTATAVPGSRQPQPPAVPDVAAPVGAGRGRDGGPRFRRLRQLGEGGFGDVWLALDTVLDREVAIKVARAPDPDTEQRICREARALAAVDHPHCVRVYDILPGIDDLPGLAIVMEYLPGPSLAQQVRSQGPLSDTAGAHLWSSLAGALDAAHRRGVLHRDVKPSNVIIDHSGQAHLIDFGIARTSGDLTLTATGLVVGTPDYLSPEVAAGGAAAPATDSWQLAATVSYALCGNPPRGHRDSAIDALRAAARGGTVTELPERSAHRDLLGRALDPDARGRPTLAQVQAELTAWLARTGRPAGGPVTRTLAAPGDT